MTSSLLHAPIALALLVCPLPAQEADASKNVLEGHSHYGEAFNEGPRQAAYLMPNDGNVHLAVTTFSGKAQRFFDQGLGQLHGFWYFEAERSFRQVAKLDPDCAMAYWGMAQANVDNEDRAKEFAHQAWRRRDGASEHERLYIDASARFYGVDAPREEEEEHAEAGVGEAQDASEAAEDTAKKDEGAQKDDAEKDGETGAKKEGAKKDDSKKDDTNKDDADDDESKGDAKLSKAEDKARRERIVKDLEEILWKYPDDIEAKALLVNQLWLNRYRGLPTPSRHANEALLQQVFSVQPMHPAHHYRIHLWDSKETAQYVVETAVKSGPSWPSVAHMWHMGGHIFARLGRHDDAAWQQEASARVDHAHMIRDRVLPDQIHNFAHNNEWLVRSMRNSGRVRDAVDLARNMVELPRHPKWNRLDKRGVSASYGRRRLFETLELFELWEDLVALADTMYLEPSEKAGDEGFRAYLLGEAHAHLGDQEAFAAQLARLRELVEGEKDARVESMEVAEEDALSDKEHAKDVREAMADALAEHADTLRDLRRKIAQLEALSDVLAGRDVDAALEVLEDERYENAHLARLFADAGESEKAAELAREALEDAEGQAYPQANLAYVLEVAGERDEALEVFRELRRSSARFDLDMPVFQRLAPLARAAGLPADWRVPHSRPADVGERVDLATLGPERWTPPLAHDWRGADARGNEVALADYRGKPHVLILFLGMSCVHCVEQLQAFDPENQAYRDAGIEIVAVGTDAAGADDVEDWESYPFPVLGDPEHGVFHDWRAWDDFEDLPLHGTFLVDAAGRVRWQDIGFEPYTDTEFLLAEAQRLLGLPDRAGAPAGGVTAASSPAESGSSGAGSR